MNNPFQEQLLKAGLVSKEQVNKVNQEKRKSNKQQRQKGKKKPVIDEKALKLKQQAEKKAARDRELNAKKEEQARQRALSNEINDLIRNNKIERKQGCELAYNFEHQGKVKRLYINEAMKKDLLAGKMGIARIEGNYELVPASVARKIQERNEKRVVLFDANSDQVDEDDPYKDFQVPDDLMW
jgi:uncharacterized protein YaiL (DUF2058 family)